TVTGGTGTAAQLTVSTVNAASASVVAGGGGYDVGDILTVTGGTGTAARLEVTAVNDGGSITGVSVNTAGSYSGNPASSVSVTGGAGAGAAFNLGLAITAVTVNTAGSYSATPANPLSVTGGTGVG